MADGIVVNPSIGLPNTSVNALQFKKFDLTIPVYAVKLDQYIPNIADNLFIGERIHVERLVFTQFPFIYLNFSNIHLDFPYGRASMLIPIKENSFCRQHA